MTMHISRFIIICALLLPLVPQAQELTGARDSTWKVLEAIPDDSLKEWRQLEFLFAEKFAIPQFAKKQALARLDKALQEQDTTKIIRYYRLLATATNILDDFSTSLRYSQIGLEYAKKTKDTAHQIDFLQYLADIRMRMGSPGEAIGYHQEAYDLAYAAGDYADAATMLSSIATVYDQMKDHQKAIRVFDRSLTLARHSGDKQVEEFVLVNMAISYKNNGRYNESLEAYRLARILADSMGHEYEKAVMTDNLANLYFAMGRLSDAETTALDAIRQSYEVNESAIRMDMYDMLSRLYEKTGAYPRSIAYLKELALLKDTVMNQEKTRQVQELEVSYDTKMKDRQITEQQTMLAANRKINLYLGLSISFLVLIVAVIYVGWRRSGRLYRQIAVQKQELEQLNSVKDRLFTAISHDMRTPVNSLISFTLLLEHATLTQEKLKAYTRELKNTLGQTASLMDNLLNFAKSQMKGFNPRIVPLDLSTIARDVLALLEAEAGYKNLKLNVTIPTGTIVYADTHMLSLVLRNILGNAIKFSRPGGEVTLALERKGHMLSILICDTGVGMPPAQAALFNQPADEAEPLASTTGTSGEKGTGMGLYLSRKFMALMQGTVQVESRPGEGSCFTVLLPAAEETAVADAIRQFDSSAI